MGAKQSKRSVDITTTPCKQLTAADAGRVEKILEDDAKANGKASDVGQQQHDGEEEGCVALANGGGGGESSAEDGKGVAEAEEKGGKKGGKKVKKKWSLRSISFSRREKVKPRAEDAAKNGAVAPATAEDEEVAADKGDVDEPVVDKAAVSMDADMQKVKAAEAPNVEAEEGKEVDGGASPEVKEEQMGVAEAGTPSTAVASPAEKEEEVPPPLPTTPPPVELVVMEGQGGGAPSSEAAAVASSAVSQAEGQVTLEGEMAIEAPKAEEEEMEEAEAPKEEVLKEEEEAPKETEEAPKEEAPKKDEKGPKEEEEALKEEEEATKEEEEPKKEEEAPKGEEEAPKEEGEASKNEEGPKEEEEVVMEGQKEEESLVDAPLVKEPDTKVEATEAVEKNVECLEAEVDGEAKEGPQVEGCSKVIENNVTESSQEIQGEE